MSEKGENVYVWQEARHQAKLMLNDLKDFEGCETLSYPIELNDFIELNLDIRVSYRELVDGVSGYIHKPTDTSDVEIVINSCDNPRRQRFTLAHELGHYYDRRTAGDLSYTFIDRRGDKYDAHEFFADEFAGSVLMPVDEFMKCVDEGMGAAAIAKYFQVSQPAVEMRAYRLRENGIS